MRERRMQIWIRVGGLALVVLLLLVGNAVAGNLTGPPDVYPGVAALQSASSWGSGWVTIATDTCTVFNHNLGADPDRYAVESWFLDTDAGGMGINRRSYGGTEVNGSLINTNMSFYPTEQNLLTL